MKRHQDLSAITALLRIRRRLAAHLARARCSTTPVLRAGAEVLSLTRAEEKAMASLLHLLEPSVREELAAEHQAIQEDLCLLQWLQHTAPDSADATTLAASLASRMCRHIDRDTRLLQRAAVIGP
jgi:hypothetical protein